MLRVAFDRLNPIRRNTQQGQGVAGRPSGGREKLIAASDLGSGTPTWVRVMSTTRNWSGASISNVVFNVCRAPWPGCRCTRQAVFATGLHPCFCQARRKARLGLMSSGRPDKSSCSLRSPQVLPPSSEACFATRDIVAILPVAVQSLCLFTVMVYQAIPSGVQSST